MSRVCTYCSTIAAKGFMAVGPMVCCPSCLGRSEMMPISDLLSAPDVPEVDQKIYLSVFGSEPVLAMEAAPVALSATILTGVDSKWDRWCEYGLLLGVLEGAMNLSSQSIRAIAGWPDVTEWMPIRCRILGKEVLVFDGLHRISVALTRGSDTIRGVVCG